MNREERRKHSTDTQRIDITGIVVHFANGQYVNLDPKLADIQAFDKVTGRSLVDQVLDAPGVVEPTTPKEEFANETDTQNYTITFDTPEGKMEYVKKGNWSGVRPVKEVN
jgi:hypothetical protein